MFFSDVFSLPVEFFSSLLTFWQVCLNFKETAENETGMAEKSNWDQANRHKN
jgi:hypothetical protein